MVHSEVYLNKYVVSIAPFSPSHPFRKLLFIACFRFLIFHPFFQGGGSADPICPYVRTPTAGRHINLEKTERHLASFDIIT